MINGVETVVAGQSTAFQLTTEGINNISYWAVDNANNAEPPHSISIKIDKSAPNIIINSPTGTISVINPAINVDVNDNISGLSFFKYYLDNSEILNTTTQLNLIYQAPGQHSFRVVATDNAGNVGNIVSNFIYSPTTQSLENVLNQMYTDGVITKLGSNLYDKLHAAQTYIDTQNYISATTTLQALINQIQAQIDIHITQSSGDLLISDINYLISTFPH